MKYKSVTRNTKINFIQYTGFIFLFIFVLVPHSVFAAMVHSSSESSVSSGDTAIIDIFLDTEGQTLNSIDGSIVLSDEHNGNFEVKDISLVNSVFTLWPRKPSVEDGGKISFIGGVPGGVTGDRLLLFKIIVQIHAAGNFKITPSTLRAYVNDGLGTALDITKDTAVIAVGVAKDTPQDTWAKIVSSDNIAPEPFTITMHQDVNLFDGKKFISFETTDAQSGISYYEVTEGSHDPVRSGTNYVLIEQQKKVTVTVTAYDKAGNFQVAMYGASESINWLSICIALLILAVLYRIIKKIKHKRKNHKQYDT